ncbi:MAG TPA: asparagine synthase (glutamine-hydrolyzing) [Thermoanaerobaculia bacterium]|jgi:asparagine synthase (glutamine-hydrolysing)
MCGIALALNADAPPSAVIGRMVDALSHRGPDARGEEARGTCALGHTRLSIIDLTTGAQPMQSGWRSITFNGEIYNYRELRDELRALGHEFQTTSDTEVLLAAHEEWGSEMLDRLRGMFAFAIWDDSTRTLFAARDLFGEKPLFFATAAGTLLIASEIKALLASGLVEGKLDRTSVDAYLALGYVPPDRTIYSDIQTLPPAHMLTWSNGRIDVARWWTPRMETRTIGLDEAGERLYAAVDRAVERQMVADVTVGAFLSGGLDSSTIVALMQRHNERPIKTFAVGFGNVVNELPYARAVANRYRTDHHEIDLARPPVAELLRRMASVYDEPFADSSNIPTYLICEFARRDVKVVLSGDGGDELFGGYGWYTSVQQALSMKGGRPRWLAMRAASVALRHRWRALARHSHALGLHARWPDPWAATLAQHINIREPQRRALWQHDAPAAKLATDVPAESIRGLNRGFYFDLTSYLPGDILVKVDRAAMAHGLETRAPFLDRDVVELALSLPERLKVDGERNKIVMRQAFTKLWPEELHGRGKQGFGGPIPVWLQNADVRAVAAEVFAPGARLRALLPGITDDMAKGNDSTTWTLLTLGLWLERWKVAI